MPPLPVRTPGQGRASAQSRTASQARTPGTSAQARTHEQAQHGQVRTHEQARTHEHVHAPEAAPRSRRWEALYRLTPVLFGSITVAAMLPSALVLAWLYGSGSGAVRLLWLLPALTAFAFLLNTFLTAVVVRTANRWLRVGDHPVHSRAGWSAWVVQGSTTGAGTARSRSTRVC
ncbi:hypothetical protein NKH77_25910 [Streptomyces sp. M19]